MAIHFSRFLRQPTTTKPISAVAGNNSSIAIMNKTITSVWRWKGTISSVSEAVDFIPEPDKRLMNTHVKDNDISALYARRKLQKEILDALYEEPEIPSIASRRTLNHPKIHPWFRGVANKEYDLTPGFQRTLSGNNKESCILDETHALSDIVNNYPELRRMSFFDALATLQHYTLPTRLLDWTPNPLSALFFACMDMQGLIDDKNDGELFILNPLKLNYYTCSRWGMLHPEHNEVLMRLRLALSTDYRSFASPSSFNDPSDPFFASQINFDFEQYKEQRKTCTAEDWAIGRLLATPVAVYPTRNNDRLIVQEGTFTLHGGKVYHMASEVDDSLRLPKPMTLEEVQASVFAAESKKRKDATTFKSHFIASVIIPKEKKHQIIAQLEQCGITFSKLLPELDYVAKATRSAWMVQSKNKVLTSPQIWRDNNAPLYNSDIPSTEYSIWDEEKTKSLDLLTAIRFGNTTDVETTFEEKGIDFFIQKGDPTWPTPLEELMVCGMYPFAASILETLKTKQRTDLINTIRNSKYLDGCSMLDLATVYGKTASADAIEGLDKCVQALRDFGVRSNLSENKKEALQLLVAIRSNDVESVVSTLEKKGFSFFGEKGENLWPTPLYEIAALGKISLLIRVLSQGNDDCKNKKISKNEFIGVLNRRNSLGWTPLYAAILYKRSDCALALLKAGASRRIEENGLQNGVISLIVRHKSRSNIELLVEAFFPNPTKDSKETNDTKTDRLHPAASTTFGLSPVHYACEVGSNDALKILLPYHKTLNVYQKNPLGRTPLQIACLNGSDDIVKSLIDESQAKSIDLDINYRTPYGRSALDFVLFSTSLRNKVRNSLADSIQFSPFFKILEILRDQTAEVIDIHGFKDRKFREIMACLRAIILDRDVNHTQDRSAAESHMGNIKNLLKKDCSTISAEGINLGKQVDIAINSLPNFIIPDKQIASIYLRSNNHEKKLKLIIDETKDLLSTIKNTAEILEKHSNIDQKIGFEFGHNARTQQARLESLISQIQGMPPVFVGNKDTVQLHTHLENVLKPLRSIIETKEKYVRLDDKGFSILSYLVRLDEEETDIEIEKGKSCIDIINWINAEAIHQIGLEENGWNIALLEACSFGASRAVKKLFELGVKIYCPIDGDKKCSGKSPLMLAAWTFRYELLEILLKKLDNELDEIFSTEKLNKTKEIEDLSEIEKKRAKLKADFLDMRNIHGHTLLSLVIMNCELLHLPEGTTLTPHNWNLWKAALKESLINIVNLLCKHKINAKKGDVKNRDDTKVEPPGNYPGIYHEHNSIFNLAAAFGAPLEIFTALAKTLSPYDLRILLNGKNSIGEAPIHSAADYNSIYEQKKGNESKDLDLEERINLYNAFLNGFEANDQTIVKADMFAKTYDGRTIKDLMK